MHRLRHDCPWDAEQTHLSLVPYLVEEACEVVEAIEAGTSADLREELGDLLLQVVFHSELAAEEGAFDVQAVAAGIADKLVARHPHVFETEDAPTRPARQLGAAQGRREGPHVRARGHPRTPLGPVPGRQDPVPGALAPGAAAGARAPSSRSPTRRWGRPCSTSSPARRRPGWTRSSPAAPPYAAWSSGCATRSSASLVCAAMAERETRRDIEAALAARRDLGPEYDESIAAGLAERIDELVAIRLADSRADVSERQLDREDERASPAAAVRARDRLDRARHPGHGDHQRLRASMTPSPGLGIVGVNLAAAWGARRRNR